MVSFSSLYVCVRTNRNGAYGLAKPLFTLPGLAAWDRCLACSITINGIEEEMASEHNEIKKFWFGAARQCLPAFTIKEMQVKGRPGTR